jgi:5-methylcytosine-specific restriction endonuclease McrA
MICKVCSNYFNPLHFNQKCCSKECKKRARAISVRKYKDTDKGKACLDRWYKNPSRVLSEKRYRSKPKTKALQVKRTTEYYKKHPEVKKRNEKAYAFRRRGYNAGYIDWKAVESLEKICNMCKTIEDLTIDHIKPLSKGGTNEISNLQILCRRCNAIKGTKYEI